MSWFEIELRVHRKRSGAVTATWNVFSRSQWWHGGTSRRVPVRKQGKYEVMDQAATPTPEVELGYLNGTLFINVCTIQLDSIIEAVYLAQRAVHVWELLLTNTQEVQT